MTPYEYEIRLITMNQDSITLDIPSNINLYEIDLDSTNFDLGFLNGELSSINKELINKEVVIDSLYVARNKFPGISNSLDALCKRFNIDLSRRTKHNALLDCELLREVYINLLGAKEPKLNLSSSSQKMINKVDADQFYNKKVLELSEADLKNHKEFLKSEIKKNFY